MPLKHSHKITVYEEQPNLVEGECVGGLAHALVDLTEAAQGLSLAQLITNVPEHNTEL